MTELRYTLLDLAEIVTDRLSKDAPHLLGVVRETFWDDDRNELVTRRHVEPKEVRVAVESRHGAQP